MIGPDFRDLLSALCAAEARFLVVGGYAVGVHGRPRATKDLDVWVEANATNAPHVMRAAGERRGSSLLHQPRLGLRRAVTPRLRASGRSGRRRRRARCSCECRRGERDLAAVTWAWDLLVGVHVAGGWVVR